MATKKNSYFSFLSLYMYRTRKIEEKVAHGCKKTLKLAEKYVLFFVRKFCSGQEMVLVLLMNVGLTVGLTDFASIPVYDPEYTNVRDCPSETT